MTCAQSKREVYLRLEQGVEADDPHLASCDDCKAALAAARRMHQAFPALGAELRPPPGWQERVFAAIDHRADERPERVLSRGWRPLVWGKRGKWRWWSALAPIAAAAAVVLLLMARREPEPPGPSDVGVASALRLDVDVARRGGDRAAASVGDVATVRASGAGGAHVALWIYRDRRQFLLGCPGDRRCRRGEGELAADLQLDRPGLYQVLFAASSNPLPPPAATLDESFAALAGTGARYKMVDLEVL